MSQRRQRLIARLKSANPRVRAKALERLDLFAWESRVVLQSVIAALQDPEPEVRGRAAYALGEALQPIREAVPHIVRNLKEDPDAYVRYCAVTALGRMKADTPEAIDALIEAVSDREMAGDAMEALGDIGVAAKRAVPTLLQALEQQVCVVAAAEALGAMGPHARSAVPAICRLLRSSDLSERRAAADALAAIGPAARESVAALLEALDDRAFFEQAEAESDRHERKMDSELRGRMPWIPAYLRVSIAVALWQIARHEAAMPTLIAALGGRHRGVRLKVVEALRDLDAPVDLAAEVAKAVNDPCHVVRATAVVTLVQMRPGVAAALPVLTGALDDPHVWVRSNAAHALGLLGPPAAPSLEALRGLLTMPDYSRLNAAMAIWQIARCESAISALIEALNDEDGYISTQAAVKLGLIGPPAKQAVSALIALSKKSGGRGGDYTSRMAIRAMKEIAGTKDWN